MADIRDWENNASGNDKESTPDFPPEGWSMGSMNATLREQMAAIRRHEEAGPGFFDWGHVVTYVSATSFSVPGDQSAIYTVGRGIRITRAGGAGGTNIKGIIKSASVSTDTTVEIIPISGGNIPSVADLYAWVGIDTPAVGSPPHAGYGGLRLETPAAGPLVVTTTPVVVGFDTEIFADPKGCTQDLPGNALNLDAGKWAVTAAISARVSGVSSAKTFIGQLYINAASIAWPGIYEGVAAGAEAVGGTLTTRLQVPAPASVQLFLSTLSGSVQVDFTDYVELSADRLDLM